uniref:SPRY domain-containing protein n=1 Tax=Macrostomum lignano TaxID=282301 RepID=A0A1I8IFM6_9PLAT
METEPEPESEPAPDSLQPTTTEQDKELDSDKKDKEEARSESPSRSRSPARASGSAPAGGADSNAAVDAEVADMLGPESPGWELDTQLAAKPRLDPYHCDLHLKVGWPDLLHARPVADEGFAFCWAGCRATHGLVVSAEQRPLRVWYEAKVTKKVEDLRLPSSEPDRCAIRFGWMADGIGTDFQLGEAPDSYGYESTGKRCANGVFEKYGQPFNIGDVVACYADFPTGTDSVYLSFAVNGRYQGAAFAIKQPSDSMPDMPSATALFPCIVAKNLAFSVQFGSSSTNGEEAYWFAAPPTIIDATEQATVEDKPQTEEADNNKATNESTEAEETTSKVERLDPRPSDYELPSEDWLSLEQAMQTKSDSVVRAAPPPPDKASCEVIFMVGLPGSGKTHWVRQHLASHPDKRYTILASYSVLDKMSVAGQSRRDLTHPQRWQLFPQRATACVATLCQLAALRRRNYIIDLTNVVPAGQAQRIRPFAGFRRAAVVIVPSAKDSAERLALPRVKEVGKEVAESDLLEMKAKFAIPDAELFDELIFPDLPEAEAREAVAQYNKEGSVKTGGGSSGGGGGSSSSSRRPGGSRFDSGRDDNS